MQAWYHCENVYPFVPQEILDRAESVRASLPNKYCDPKISADLFEECLDEHLLCDELGINVVSIEHHSGINSLYGSSPMILGIKISDRETPDILDIFNKSPDEVRRRSWHDPDRFAPDHNAMSDEALVVHARNREALCLYAWRPYMYNPQLPRWLGRIAAPTLMVWGASDRVVTPEYGRAYARLIPGSRLALIERAGHHPEIEQPEAFVERVAAFLEE